MARKIFSGLLIAISSILLLSSLAGIGLAWIYNEPLTREALSRLGQVEAELSQTQKALQEAKTELERTLRIVDTAEQTLSKLSDDLEQAKTLLDEFDQTMGDSLIPGLEGARDSLNQTKGSLQELLTGLRVANSLPFISLNLPGEELLEEFIVTVDSIDSQIGQMQEMVDKASTFTKDFTFLIGGDFSDTRDRLEGFLAVVSEYEGKVGGWRAQVEGWIASLPVWIDRAAVILTVFLLWFGLSQFGLLLHGLSIWRGQNPFAALRRAK